MNSKGSRRRRCTNVKLNGQFSNLSFEVPVRNSRRGRYLLTGFLSASLPGVDFGSFHLICSPKPVFDVIAAGLEVDPKFVKLARTALGDSMNNARIRLTLMGLKTGLSMFSEHFKVFKWMVGHKKYTPEEYRIMSDIFSETARIVKKKTFVVLNKLKNELPIDQSMSPKDREKQEHLLDDAIQVMLSIPEDDQPLLNVENIMRRFDDLVKVALSNSGIIKHLICPDSMAVTVIESSKDLQLTVARMLLQKLFDFDKNIFSRFCQHVFLVTLPPDFMEIEFLMALYDTHPKIVVEMFLICKKVGDEKLNRLIMSRIDKLKMTKSGRKSPEIKFYNFVRTVDDQTLKKELPVFRDGGSAQSKLPGALQDPNDVPLSSDGTIQMEPNVESKDIEKPAELVSESTNEIDLSSNAEDKIGSTENPSIVSTIPVNKIIESKVDGPIVNVPPVLAVSSVVRRPVARVPPPVPRPSACHRLKLFFKKCSLC